MSAAEDARFMAAALRLSRWHSGQTDTNPSVGCIIVKDGAIVGAAVTAIGGRPHAETQALAMAGEQALGATAYVTLEPCAHYGRTPPCANALVAARVARVVVSVTDPDPRVSGHGIAILREAGIVVEAGLLEEEGRRTLAAYLMRQTNHRPYVTVKLAVSADGMLGRRGEEISITGPLARAQVHMLRAESDAILVGLGTVLCDDPELTVRISGLRGRSPIRIVLDRRLELPPNSALVRSARDVAVIVGVVGGGLAPAEAADHAARRENLADAGVHVIEAYDLAELLHKLAARGISSLFVEGGATVAGAFVDAGLVDRVILFQGPGTVGGDGLESPLTPSDMPEQLVLVRKDVFGPDRAYEYERGL